MKNAPVEIMAALLQSKSTALIDLADPIAKGWPYFKPPTAPLTQGFPLYMSLMPDGPDIPDDAAAIYDTEGMIHARLIASGRNVQSDGIQIKTRAVDYREGRVVLENLAQVLSGIRHIPITLPDGNSYVIDTIKQMGPVTNMGADDQRRAFHSLNIVVMLLALPDR